jgi:uncharacterized protein YutE (UPF0331/DUF86 family)
MALVDKQIVMRKISDLEIYYLQMKDFSEISAEEYMSNWKTQRIVERTLQMMIETCVDITNHIISDVGMRIPETYADTFKVLSENKIIGQELFSVMGKMAKFRNIVVHQYEEIDSAIVILILRKHLSGFQQFRDAILSYLQNH